ncbi:hypothetical protein A1O1_05510 [Capronia coronata CBS 617.96]|uniref:FAD-binding domain-containing protein n=1 Tax=Capronia coronata CBS 617.96 TaxID=1182541 RepID=W9YFY4_9EURO|nr:uncharacterized protein A1O1_05510 [Capronia coronata CBS 617.96]EXJ88580.1 hypothetical protein A1O1_05510 [Capronia coronata CBS 617.96]
MGSISPSPPLHIAIVGAGIGGLALAIGLLRQGVPYTLYEAAGAYSAVGAGVGLGPNALAAMDAIDARFRALYNQISTGNVTPGKDHVMMDAMLLEDGFGEKRGWKPAPYGAPCYDRTSAHRVDLLNVMTSLIPISTVKFNKRVKTVDQKAEGGAKVTITFEDGEVVEASAVIGCDGAKGATRQMVLGEKYPDQVRATYSGKYVYRSIVPMEDAVKILGKDALGDEIAGDAKMFIGKGANVTTFPISKGTQCNMVAFKLDDKPWTYPEWTQPVTREEMVNDFEELGVDKRLIKMLDWAKPLRWSIHHHLTTPVYYNGLICLLGDSAHATTPHQAAGAGQCLEDALILSRLLGLVSAPDRDQLEAAFKVYDEIRRPRAQKVVQTSKQAGLVYTLSAPGIGDDLDAIVKDLNHRFLWIWEHDLMADVDRAEKEFKALTRKEPETMNMKRVSASVVEKTALTA